MSNPPLFLPDEYWHSLQVEDSDVEFLHTILFEDETPLTAEELAAALVEERIRREREALLQKKQGKRKIFLPKETYKAGDSLVFPALNWQKGTVKSVRPGVGLEESDFDVLTVEMESGEERFFAARLPNHPLNEAPQQTEEEGVQDPASVFRAHGAVIAQKIEDALSANPELVKIAGRWFPKALLVEVNVGHLNLAEAILDMKGGEPLPTEALLKDLELPEGINPSLAAFSLNYALQEDPRFDEVGPAGQVMWCLERLEPPEVRETPAYLRYDPIPYDRAHLTEEMLALERQLDDELSEISIEEEAIPKEALISLIYPHWRTGTLPVSPRVRTFFPTAYESPRIRFTLVDAKTGEKFPGWVVRERRYVYGLREWYEENNLIPGSLIRIRPGTEAGEVLIEAQTHRATRDWVRTVIVGADGGLVFAMLKQVLNADFDERMVLAVPSVEAIDEVWDKSNKTPQPFDRLVLRIMRELTKLTPQGHVHAQELYSALNIIRRCPPAPIFALLAEKPWAVHVGDCTSV